MNLYLLVCAAKVRKQVKFAVSIWKIVRRREVLGEEATRQINSGPNCPREVESGRFEWRQR
jgi:hypothetical protein